MGISRSSSIGIILALVCCLAQVQADSTKSYMVGLRTSEDGKNYCAGALVSPRYVLTSNRCTHIFKYTTWIRIKVYYPEYAVIGSKYVEGTNDGETILVVGWTSHPKYNQKTNENDYLLLKLNKPSTRTPVTMIPWPYNDDDPFKNTADTTVMGWGTGPNTSVTSELSTAHMMVLQYSECQDYMPNFNSDLCLKGGDKDATCKVDYGSPVLATVKNGSEFLGGVITNVKGCGHAGIPLKADSVQQVRNWIKSVTGR